MRSLQSTVCIANEAQRPVPLLAIQVRLRPCNGRFFGERSRCWALRPICFCHSGGPSARLFLCWHSVGGWRIAASGSLSWRSIGVSFLSMEMSARRHVKVKRNITHLISPLPLVFAYVGETKDLERGGRRPATGAGVSLPKIYMDREGFEEICLRAGRDDKRRGAERTSAGDHGTP